MAAAAEQRELCSVQQRVSLPVDKHRRSSCDIRERYLVPSHLTSAQLGKLEDKFNNRKWPDEFTIRMIALESNMLETHVAVRSTYYIHSRVCIYLFRVNCYKFRSLNAILSTTSKLIPCTFEQRYFILNTRKDLAECVLVGSSM